MKILKLELMDFGQFHNRVIEFEDGFNLVYGENEAGKSTIWHFVIGMFFGFYKPYMKKKVAYPELEKYKPWRGGGYRGAMVIHDEKMNRQVRILRSFEGSGEVKVFDDVTGEEITGLYDIHPVHKLPDVAAKHLEMSYTAFVNTLGLKQLGHKTDTDLKQEIQNTIVNALSTRSLDIPMNKVFAKLSEKQKDIGSNRLKSSSFALKNNHIKALELEKEQVAEINQEVVELKLKKEDVVTQKELLEKDKKALAKAERINEWLHKKALFEKVNSYQEEKVKALEELQQLDFDEKLNLDTIRTSFDSYKECLQLSRVMKEYNQRIEGLKKDALHLEAELQSHDTKESSSYSSEDITKDNDNKLDITKLNQDIYDCQSIENHNHDYQQQLSQVERDYQELELKIVDKQDQAMLKHKANQRMLMLGSGILFLIGLALFMVDLLFGGIGLIVAVLVFVIGNKLISGPNSESELTQKLHKLKLQKEELNSKLEKGHIRYQEIIQEYKCTNIAELITLKDTFLQQELLQKSNVQMVENLKAQLTKVKMQLLKEEESKLSLQQQMDKHKAVYQPMVEEQKISSKEDFEALIQKAKINNELLSKKDLAIQRIKDLIGDTNIEEFQKQLATIPEGLDTESLGDEESIQGLISGTEEELKSLKDKISRETLRIEKRLSELNAREKELLRGRRNLVDIDEEISFESSLLEEMKHKLAVYKKVEASLMGITDELQHSFAPVLNKRISTMVSQLTSDKYQDVKVNPELFMRLTDPSTGESVMADSLSQGTMDVFYMALRYGIIGWINDETDLPMIFDEVFAHLDDLRLEKALNFFQGLDNQVILFTCQKREIDLLNTSRSNIITL